MVPPFDHEWIIAGQGTAGLEILEQCPDVAAIAVPVGGGGLLAGVAAAVKQMRPNVKVVGVEPAGAAAMKASIDAGPRRHAAVDRQRRRRPDAGAPGDQTLAHVQAFVDAVVTVDDPDDHRRRAVDLRQRQDRRRTERRGHDRGRPHRRRGRCRQDRRSDRRHRQRRKHVAGDAAGARGIVGAWPGARHRLVRPDRRSRVAVAWRLHPLLT